MTKQQRQRLEQRLLRERERALKAIAAFDERYKDSPQIQAGNLSLYPFHPADDGTDTMEQEKDYLLASNEGRILYAIDDALRRLYRSPERFGVCENCDREIAYERLVIVPWAQFCVECQRAEEQRRIAA
ncbi:MAG TPA: TraR/DksA C4-type zinc finger protein [Longimicrobiales bacterium]|nr:TraR/DksA C4-type zinc finger protein [Longimicrobiales bacterium]